MPRDSNKPKESFVYTSLKLDLSKEQNLFWNKKFKILSLMVNKAIFEVSKMCDEYNEVVKDGLQYYRDGNKKAGNDIFKQFKHLRPAYKQKELRDLRNTKLKRYKSNIQAQIFNSEVERIVKYAEQHLIFSKKSNKQKKFKKTLRYIHVRNPLYILTSGNKQTINFNLKTMLCKFGKYRFKISNGDTNNKHRIGDLIDYCKDNLVTEIKIHRKKSISGWEYYLIFTIAGQLKKPNTSAKQFQNTSGLVTVDINLNQVDIRKCDSQEEFSIDYYNKSQYDKYNNQITVLQQKLDQLYRLHNPQCYNDNGTGIKGKKCKIVSNRMKLLHNKIQVLRSKFSSWRKNEYGRLVNFIRQCGDELVIEKNSIDGWKTKGKTSKNMRKAVQQNAPGLFVTLLKNKFDKVHELDTYKTKCTITCHKCGTINRIKGRIYHCTNCGITVNRHINAIRTMESVIRSTSCVS